MQVRMRLNHQPTMTSPVCVLQDILVDWLGVEVTQHLGGHTKRLPSTDTHQEVAYVHRQCSARCQQRPKAEC